VFGGHPDVVDADLADYFGSIPHADLVNSVARRIVDRRALSDKMWRTAPYNPSLIQDVVIGEIWAGCRLGRASAEPGERLSVCDPALPKIVRDEDRTPYLSGRCRQDAGGGHLAGRDVRAIGDAVLNQLVELGPLLGGRH
jgi:hypothetical protein